MGNPVSGIQQAGTDRAQRIQQMLEQRHLQTEMAAAAHLKENLRKAIEVSDAGESHHAKPGDREGGGQGAGDGAAGERRREQDDGPPSAPGDTGRIVDVSV